MRSEYVFAAAKKIDNRFMLCRVTSVSARRLQVNSKQPSETINKSLCLIAAMVVGTNSNGEELPGGSGHLFSLAGPALLGEKQPVGSLLDPAPLSS